jgi:glycosyltransferase involved in cell wall biosynthesis
MRQSASVHCGQKPRIVFIYLGRRGALGRFTLELAQAASSVEDVDIEFVISSENEIVGQFVEQNVGFATLPTFKRATPANLVLGYRRVQQALLNFLAEKRATAVVTLMPHVWSPLLSRGIKRMGIRYVSVIHDVVPHPGDKTAWLTPWLLRDAKHADLVVTLSRSVAERLVGQKRISIGQILPLFHPDLRFGSSGKSRTLDPDRPFRILFFGRIMAYKGLSLLIDAVEMLRASGHQIRLGIAGSGPLGAELERLRALDAEIMNRWISDDEVSGILARYDAIACSHVEASQSGVVATAFGNCMPVVAMPVGGIAEQVVDGKTGVLARRVSAQAFADAIRRLMADGRTYASISHHLRESAADRSMDRFLLEIAKEVELLTADRNARS